ncbi:MAG TPA: flippase [Gemmatimonadaceae bacterium]|nr:flippase [Gemmatimonadaceae bacterium]
MSTGRLLARNSALNFFGQVVPILVAIVAIPPLVRGLGPERFGVLTLAWAAIGYFSLFELGLSRALTQAVAHRLGAGAREDLPEVTWTALALLFLLGCAGSLVVAALTPPLVNRVLNIPLELRQETMRSFWILAASLPLVVFTVGLRGLMEAHQHFGVATLLRVPLAALMFVGPLLVLPFSRSLVPAVSILALARAAGFLAHLAFCLRAYPYLRQRVAIARGQVRPLLRFGGWMTVSNIVSPMMVFLDRFLVGALLPLAAVAHYVTPYEASVRMLLLPMALLGAMLPAFAATVHNNAARMAQLYDRSLRGVLLVMFPVVLVGVALAREGLSLWVGPVLPETSAVVMQWLLLGVFINGMAQAPLTALHSAARPDLVAKLHVVELPFYAVGIYLLVHAFGLAGVAVAWTARVAIDAAALLWIARRTLGLRVLPDARVRWALILMLALIGGAALPGSTQPRVIFVVTSLLLFAPIGWFVLLQPTEREGLMDWLRRPTRTTLPPSEELA